MSFCGYSVIDIHSVGGDVDGDADAGVGIYFDVAMVLAR